MKHAEKLTKLTRLRFLKLGVRILRPSTISSDADNPYFSFSESIQLREDLARDFVTTLVKTFGNCIDTIEKVIVTFRVGRPNAWGYMKWTFTAHPKLLVRPRSDFEREYG